MSEYELIDYDDLLRRIGIAPGETWFCGNNPPVEWTFDQAGLSYDDIYADDRTSFHSAYDGRAQKVAGGLCLNSDINVNGLQLNHRDLNGTIWLCTNIEGWWTLPPSEIADVPKPYWDGSMLTTGRYLTRTITVSGAFIPPSKDWVWYNRDLILRCGGIVRGVGLLAVCGNADMSIVDPSGDYLDPFYDPSKMAIIQTSDVPLVDTTKPNGFTQFSLSFRSVQPTKQSIIEHSKTLTVPTGVQNRLRLYKSFDEPAGVTAGDTTEYVELPRFTGSSSLRDYANVQKFNPDSPIPDEDGDYTVASVIPDKLYVNNRGNYFAFPVYVFGQTEGVSVTNTLKLTNLATGESMEIVKPLTTKTTADNYPWVLVVDTAARRVAYVDPRADPAYWVWDDRSYLSLTSDWVSLASGKNEFVIDKGAGVTVTGAQPKIYWRDTWIG